MEGGKEGGQDGWMDRQKDEQMDLSLEIATRYRMYIQISVCLLPESILGD